MSARKLALCFPFREYSRLVDTYYSATFTGCDTGVTQDSMSGILGPQVTLSAARFAERCKCVTLLRLLDTRARL